MALKLRGYNLFRLHLAKKEFTMKIVSSFFVLRQVLNFLPSCVENGRKLEVKVFE